MTGGKVLSVVLAVSGVLVLGTSKHSPVQGTSPAYGVLLALIASLCAAIYKVAFKVAFPGALSVRQLSTFLSLIGAINLVAGTGPCVLLGATALVHLRWHRADDPCNHGCGRPHKGRQPSTGAMARCGTSFGELCRPNLCWWGCWR
jgi:drug/metabolite transporter (DMT)-like permease